MTASSKQWSDGGTIVNPFVVIFAAIAVALLASVAQASEPTITDIPEVEMTLDGQFIVLNQNIDHKNDTVPLSTLKHKTPHNVTAYNLPNAGPSSAYGTVQRFVSTPPSTKNETKLIPDFSSSASLDVENGVTTRRHRIHHASARPIIVPDAYGAAPIDLGEDGGLAFGAPNVPAVSPILSFGSTVADTVDNIDGTNANVEVRTAPPPVQPKAAGVATHEGPTVVQPIKRQPGLVSHHRRQYAAPTANNGEEEANDSVVEAAFPLPNCYRTVGGFLCCNKLLEEMIYGSHNTVESKKLSTCNIQAFAQDLQLKAQETFHTTFEVIIGTGDFASKTRFRDNLICKSIVKNKVVLIYATPEPYSLEKSNTPLSFS